ncbi:MAG: hypothetical protein ACYS22_08035, partial [Planctomycetota bacterium]
TDTFTYTITDRPVGDPEGLFDTATVSVFVEKDTDCDTIPDEEEIEKGSNPCDADTDDDGVSDGIEGAIDLDPTTAADPYGDFDGDGAMNVLDPDSDDDGICDGTELGVVDPVLGPDGLVDDAPMGNGTYPGSFVFIPDGDAGATVTNPLDPDTDDGGALDGEEDINGDGVQQSNESDPTAGNPVDDGDSRTDDADGDGLTDAEEVELGTDPTMADTDGDGLEDGQEIAHNLDPLDMDMDDDGIRDGDEPNALVDGDCDGLIGALDPDSDNDGILDGTEVGVVNPIDDPDGLTGPLLGTDLTEPHFFADADQGQTTTSMVNMDTDKGAGFDGWKYPFPRSEGNEDSNHNGQIDLGEGDPNDGTDDLTGNTVIDTDNDGLSDDNEATIGTNPLDADTDDDGVWDGHEPNPTLDRNRDGDNNPFDNDSDGDKLTDAQELAINTPVADADGEGPLLGTDLGAGQFTPDDDTRDKTRVLVADFGDVPNPIDPSGGDAAGVQGSGWGSCGFHPQAAGGLPVTAMLALLLLGLVLGARRARRALASRS